MKMTTREIRRKMSKQPAEAWLRRGKQLCYTCVTLGDYVSESVSDAYAKVFGFNGGLTTVTTKLQANNDQASLHASSHPTVEELHEVRCTLLAFAYALGDELYELAECESCLTRLATSYYVDQACGQLAFVQIAGDFRTNEIVLCLVNGQPFAFSGLPDVVRVRLLSALSPSTLHVNGVIEQ
jgi:hypothetical protein